MGIPAEFSALVQKNSELDQNEMRVVGRVARAQFAETSRAVLGEYDSKAAFGRLGRTPLQVASPPQPSLGGFLPQGELLPSGFTVFGPGKEALEFQYPTDMFSHISFLNISQDGRFVGVLGNDMKHQYSEPACRLLVWNVDTQEIVLDHVQTRRLNRFVFNRNGSRVAAYYCYGPVSNLNETRDVVVAIDVIEQKVLGEAQHGDDVESAVWLASTRAERIGLRTVSSSPIARRSTTCLVSG